MNAPRRRNVLVPGTVLVGLVAAVGLLGLFWTPQPPNEMHLLARYRPPGPEFLLGTDQFGRDVLSRSMAGAVDSLTLGLFAPLLALSLALPLALVAGFKRGRIERVLIGFVDSTLSIPTLILALLVIVALGVGHVNAIFALAVAMAPKFARVLYAATIDEVAKDYVTAAIARGESTPAILVREILPNIWAPVLVETSIYIGFGITAGASLSYLGLGTQPPGGDWGLLIRDAWANIGGSAWPLLGPALMLVAAVVGVNLLGDGLRDRLLPDRQRDG